MRRTPVCFVGDTLFAGSIGRSNPKELYSTISIRFVAVC